MAVFFFFLQNLQKHGQGRFTISPVFFSLENVVYFETSTCESHFFPMLRRFFVFFRVHNFHHILALPSFSSSSTLLLSRVTSPSLSTPLLPSRGRTSAVDAAETLIKLACSQAERNDTDFILSTFRQHHVGVNHMFGARARIPPTVICCGEILEYMLGSGESHGVRCLHSETDFEGRLCSLTLEA